MSTDKKVPSVPEVRVQDPAAQRVLEAVKQILETREGSHDPLDRAITLRDLVNLGLAEVTQTRNGRNLTATVQPTVTGGEDSAWASVPPPDPVGFVATGAFASILLNWEVPGYANHAYTEIWRDSAAQDETAPAFDLTRAQLVDVISNGPYTDHPTATQEPRTFYYWLRHVSTSGLRSGLSDRAEAQLATDPGYIMSVLLGENSPYNEGDPLLIEVDTPTTVNGVYVPAGIYIRDLFVQNGTITNAKIANLAVDDAKIGSVSATKITTGELQATRSIEVNGHIFGGKPAYGSDTAGFWIGNDGADYRLAIGDANYYLRWTGSSLAISGSISASSISASTIEGSQFIADGGHVRGGKATYSSTVPGFWLGDDAGEYKFVIGDDVNYLAWSGTALVVQARMQASEIHETTMVDSVLDSTNTLIAPSIIYDPDYIPGDGGGTFVAAEGQTLNDPENIPERLCLPRILTDASMGAINPASAASYLLNAADATREFFNGSGGATDLIFGGYEDSAGIVRRFVTELRYGADVASSTFTNHKLSAHNETPAIDALNPAHRAAKSTATLRLRITDKAKFNYSCALDLNTDFRFDNNFETGAQIPPWWLPGLVSVSTSGNVSYGGFSGLGGTWSVGSRLFQVMVYPAYGKTRNLPATALIAQSYNQSSRSTHLKPNWPAATDTWHTHVLDLSCGDYTSEIAGDDCVTTLWDDDPAYVLPATVTNITGGSAPGAPLMAGYRSSGLWASTSYGPGFSSLTGVANTDSSTQDDWTITGSFDGETISVVAEKTIDFSVEEYPGWGGGNVFPRYAAVVRLGASYYLQTINYIGYVPFYKMLPVYADWPHLDVQVEIECDNRVYVMEAKVLT